MEVVDRRRGYEAALRAAGQPIDPDLIVYAEWWSEHSARELMAALLDRAPDLDAIFVNSDVMAIAAMEVIADRGFDVPRDIAVVGYDDVPLAARVRPPLTTIRQDPALAGRLLAEGAIQNALTGAITSTSIPAELVVRGSA